MLVGDEGSGFEVQVLQHRGCGWILFCSCRLKALGFRVSDATQLIQTRHGLQKKPEKHRIKAQAVVHAVRIFEATILAQFQRVPSG